MHVKRCNSSRIEETFFDIKNNSCDGKMIVIKSKAI